MTNSTIPEAIHRAAGFQYNGEFFLAEMMFRQLVQIDPPDHMARYLYGLFKLMRGEFDEAWPLFQERLQTDFYREKGSMKLPQPWWHGEDAADKTLLVHADQGIGDAILCARFLPQVADRVGRLILGIHKNMTPFFRAIDPRIEVVEMGDQLPQFDIHVDFFSLLSIFGAKPGNIPAPPYVTAEPGFSEHWKKRLDGPGLAVGLVWQGEPTHARDNERSIPLKDMEPVLRTPGVRFYGLQVGAGAEQVTDIPKAVDFTDLSADLTGDGMMDTSAVIENLDLVITVDTAVANLAGAMGRPLWVLLSKVPDWRWIVTVEPDLPNFAPGPWFPDARLFHQETRWDWTGVIAKMADELGAL